MMDRLQGMERPPPPLVHTWQSALAVGRRTVTVTMYFLAFFRLYLSCENSVLASNVELLLQSSSMISDPDWSQNIGKRC